MNTQQQITEQIKAVQREINSCNEVLYGWNHEAAYNADAWDSETMSYFQISKAHIIREIEELEAARKALYAQRKALETAVR